MSGENSELREGVGPLAEEEREASTAQATAQTVHTALRKAGWREEEVKPVVDWFRLPYLSVKHPTTEEL